MIENKLFESAKAQDEKEFKRLLKTEDLNALMTGYEFTPEQSKTLLDYVILPDSEAQMTVLGALILENQKEEKYTPYIQEMLANPKLDLERPIFKVNGEPVYALRFLLAADTTKDFVNLKALLKRQDFDVNREASAILRPQCSPVKAVMVMAHPKMDVNLKSKYMFSGEGKEEGSLGYVGEAECPIWMAAGVETAYRLLDSIMEHKPHPDGDYRVLGPVAFEKFQCLMAKKPADGRLIGCRFKYNEGILSDEEVTFGFKPFLKTAVKTYARKLNAEDKVADVCHYVESLTDKFRKDGIRLYNEERFKKTPEHD